MTTNQSPEGLAILRKHGVLSDELAAQLPADARDAFHRLTAMTDHRGDGIPTQYCYPTEVRAAASVLCAAVLRAQEARPEAVEVVFETVGDRVVGTTAAKVKRVERQDDGTLTVIIDHWSAALSEQPRADAAEMRELLVETKELLPNAAYMNRDDRDKAIKDFLDRIDQALGEQP